MRTEISPNFTRGFVMNPKGIILHHSAGTFQGDIAWIKDPKSKASYHALVSPTGELVVFGQDNRRMFHAGVSSFNGRKDCNSFMLGIAVTGDTNKREISDIEAKVVAEWCVSKMKLYGFGLDMITTHRHVSPNRKNDVDVRAERKIKETIAKLL
jgi:N-acetylmuramoyl-L-alanine amidase